MGRQQRVGHALQRDLQPRALPRRRLSGLVVQQQRLRLMLILMLLVLLVLAERWRESGRGERRGAVGRPLLEGEGAHAVAIGAGVAQRIRALRLGALSVARGRLGQQAPGALVSVRLILLRLILLLLILLLLLLLLKLLRLFGFGATHRAEHVVVACELRLVCEVELAGRQLVQQQLLVQRRHRAVVEGTRRVEHGGGQRGAAVRRARR